MAPDTKGFLYPVVDESQCIDCGLCLEVCPYASDDNVGSELYPHTAVYAAKLTDETTRIQSASGGAFIALSHLVLAKQGVVYGVGYDKHMTARHMRATSLDQCNAFSGSKYVQSNLGTTFKDVERDLKGDLPVLFTGTPCQVAGLRMYLQKEYDNLILVDLICHGVPSQKLFKEYLSLMEHQQGSAVIDCTFRDKSQGWKNLVMKLDFASHSKTIDASESSFYTLFVDGTILRPSCYECKFSNFNRPSDITIGDYWGIEHTMPQFDDEHGISLVLVNSRKGAAF
ncbi:MAG TPA: Coenzyme F420 hydrogenase/dehydrogenase, beta subunit C-terminal domain, partial [Sphaerochaeta sp.]|nr:Coenzyme F420 hydrogenase/dehydrogenase, beta subunit C-terminal domain [Sphaerochaeta sp.]